MNKNQYNKQGQKHGYWEEYHSNGKLRYKGKYVNGKRDGMWEYYNRKGELTEQEFYIR